VTKKVRIEIPVVIGEDYGETVKARLAEYGITQRDVAEEAGIAETQLSRWLTGKSYDTGEKMDLRLSSVVKLERAILALRQKRKT
jgi:transcriptional regulator with XRE-family HTH domain